MKRTTNYSLPTWEKSDFIKMDDFNDLTKKTDSALKTNADAVAAKAEASTVTAIAQALGTGGQNCRIAWGSYTGSGKYGSANPNTLNFDFKPMIVVIASDGYGALGSSRFIRPLTYGTDQSNNVQKVTWGEKSFSWYYPNTTNGSLWQNNTNGYTYYYVAVGY